MTGNGMYQMTRGLLDQELARNGLNMGSLNDYIRNIATNGIQQAMPQAMPSTSGLLGNQSQPMNQNQGMDALLRQSGADDPLMNYLGNSSLDKMIQDGYVEKYESSVGDNPATEKYRLNTANIPKQYLDNRGRFLGGVTDIGLRYRSPNDIAGDGGAPTVDNPQLSLLFTDMDKAHGGNDIRPEISAYYGKTGTETPQADLSWYSQKQREAEQAATPWQVASIMAPMFLGPGNVLGIGGQGGVTGAITKGLSNAVGTALPSWTGQSVVNAGMTALQGGSPTDVLLSGATPAVSSQFSGALSNSGLDPSTAKAISQAAITLARGGDPTQVLISALGPKAGVDPQIMKFVTNAAQYIQQSR